PCIFIYCVVVVVVVVVSMPIDLKWVRQDPHQVREWQTQRRRRFIDDENSGDPVDLVDVVVQKDELCRNKLQTLEEYKRSLNQLQKKLKPIRCNNTNKNKKEKEKKKKNAPDDELDDQSSSLLSPLSSTIRQDLIEEKKLLEEKIKKANILWKDSFKDTQEALCKLASPIGGSTITVTDDVTDINIVEDVYTEIMLPSLLSSTMRSGLGMDLEQAWKQYTLRYFAAYSWVELPQGVPVIRRRQQQQQQAPAVEDASFSIDPDRAHALWGCCDYKNNNNNNHLKNKNNCPICIVAATVSSSSSSSSSTDDYQPIVMLPTWIRLLSELLPNKSIWGDKELPKYTALWSSSNNVATSTPQIKQQLQSSNNNNICWLGGRSENNESGEDDEKFSRDVPPPSSSESFSLELMAITASSVVDAREIQNNLVEEISNYYQSLLMMNDEEEKHNQDQLSTSSSQDKNKLLLRRRVVPAPDLNCHEWSRVEIHVQIIQSKKSSSSSSSSSSSTTHNNYSKSIETLCLGWVSNWGDATSRACDMAFAGGGVATQVGGKNSKSSKSTTKEYVHVVQASIVDSSTWNKILFANRSTDISRQKMIVKIPNSILPYLIRPLPRERKNNVDGDCQSNHTEDVIIPLEELVVDMNSKKKKKLTVFGVKDHAYKQQQQPVISSTNKKVVARDTLALSYLEDTPKFAPFCFNSSIREEELQQRIRGEKLACPFDFLFNY
ncbi:MAG: seryl-tRNA synthetase, partial [Bacillariaceae sp.]